MELARKITAQDGTQKFLFKLADGNFIESVLIFHTRTTTACVSSQVGCAMKCSFCATGMMGFSRNLSVEEIVGQFDEMNKIAKITNVVFMGMGEPLHNYDAVVQSIHEFKKRGLSWRKITVSTVGIPARIKTLWTDAQCMLALSLHAPTDALRQKIVPMNAKYSIEHIFDALKSFPLRKKNPLMVEYVMLAGVNDQNAHAQELAELLNPLPGVHVNLIAYNPVAGLSFNRPSLERCKEFKQILIEQGIKTIIRTTKGMDSDAACGMLTTKNDLKKTSSPIVGE